MARAIGCSASASTTFLTSGPLIRFVTKTLLRRIIFANIIGLAILLGGIFYLSQYHAWLIDAKRESLRAQGEIIAAAIAANASVETGRIVLDPDRLPEIEGAGARSGTTASPRCSCRSRPSG